MSKRKHEDEPESGNGFSIEAIPGGLENGEVISKPKRVPKTPAHLPRLHLLAGAFGVVRSGKTNAVVNLMQAYWDAGSLNVLYCISPTYESNTSLQTLPFEKIYSDSKNSIQSLEAIIQDVEDRSKEYVKEKTYRVAHNRWRKWQNGTGKAPPDWKDRILLLNENYRTPKKIKWPCPGVFIDDMTHTELMANTINNSLSHLSLRHRHLANVGLSIFQAFQTFKSGKSCVCDGAIAYCSKLGLGFLPWSDTSLLEFQDFFEGEIVYDAVA